VISKVGEIWLVVGGVGTHGAELLMLPGRFRGRSCGGFFGGSDAQCRS
jgi:hypothetical protein